MRRPDERGAGTILTAGACSALMVVVWCSCVLVAWLGQISAAQDAADLAALGAASAVAGEGDPCPVAHDVAGRNGAEVVGCTVEGDRWGFVVNIRVRVPLDPPVPGAPRSVERVAWAGSLQ